MKASALGSYPRVGEGPEKQRLRRAIQQCQAGKIPQDELRRIQDEVTVEALEEQAAAGLDWVTDGLIRWEDGQTYFTDRLSGFERGGLLRYFDTNTYYRQPVTTGAVAWREPITVADWQFARDHSELPVRPVVTGPYTLARLSHDQHYGDRRRFGLDLAAAMNQELRALAAAGAEVLQVDEPALTRWPDEEPLARELFGKLIEGVERPVTVAVFMGPVTPLVEALGKWPAAGLWLDCVTDPKALERLSAVPVERALGLGLVDARNTRLEAVEEVLARLKSAVERRDPERLALTTSAGLEFLPRDRAQLKLRRVAEAARAFEGKQVHA